MRPTFGGVFDLWAVNDQFERNPWHPGARGCGRRWAPDRAGLTDSDLEELFVSIWWPTGLPRPQTRFHIDPGDGGMLIRADFAWPEAKFRSGTRREPVSRRDRRRQRDYRRDQRLKRARWDVLRVGDEQLNDDPDTVVAIVWGLLRRLPPDMWRSGPDPSDASAATALAPASGQRRAPGRAPPTGGRPTGPPDPEP